MCTLINKLIMHDPIFIIIFIILNLINIIRMFVCLFVCLFVHRATPLAPKEMTTRKGYRSKHNLLSSVCI